MSEDKSKRFPIPKPGLLLAVAVSLGVLAALGMLAREFQNARNEQVAYQELCRLGATGDDWVGYREILFGRNHRPIVQIKLPSTVTVEGALPYLKQLDNLEYLDLSGNPISDNDLKKLKKLHWIYSLGLSSTSITDAGLTNLEPLTELRFLGPR